MEQQQGFYYVGLLIGGLIAGALCGAAPLIIGFVRENRKLGFIGFACCIVGGLVLGLILAIPLAIFFSVGIVLKKKDKDNFTTPPNPPDFSE